MALYHKHRPGDFEKVYGNEKIISSLTAMVANGKCPHVILFQGPTGCGKTTLARIVAGQLGCTGSDYREVNSSDFRGIDTAREIIKQTAYRPIESSCRVWVIDECHKLTNDAQNALLKTLEDTPQHVYFILCTTEPNKLIAAIKNRCSVYQVELLSDALMTKLIQRTVKRERDSLDAAVVEQIVSDAQGHPRQALQILEQVLSVEPGLRLETAKRSAEQVSQAIELCRALMSKSKWGVVSKILEGLKDQDPEGVRRVVLGYAQSVLLKSDNPTAGYIMECFIEPFYNSGFPGLTYACYSVVKG